MKFDAGFEGAISEVAKWASQVENTDLFEGAWVSDTTNDPFLLSTLVGHSTTKLEFGTNIAVAFSRSPYCVAQTCSNLQGLFGGRFHLGLGTQVKPHIERRFSAQWPDDPVQALCEYVELLRHLFSKFESGERPSFRGEHYSCTLNSPVFTPDRHAEGAPSIGFSAVGRRMTEAAGRIAEAVFLHPFTHLKYLEEITLPALRRGKEKREPSLRPLQLVGTCFTLANDQPNFEVRRQAVLQRLAFYASTPNYLKVMESLGLGELHGRLHEHSRRGEWSQMSRALPERMIEECVVIAPTAQLLSAVEQRFRGIYDRVVIDPSPFFS